MEKHYQIKYANHTFHATVMSESIGIHRIKFGGKRSCVVFSVYDEEPEPNLDSLTYASDCAVDVNVLEPGRGPGASRHAWLRLTLLMAKAAIQFVYTLFPEQRDVKFKDWSEVECDKGRVVPLAYLYLAKYKKTWYQAKLGAELEDAGAADRLREFVRWMGTPAAKAPFDQFVREYVDPCNFRTAEKAKLIEVLRRFYENATSYHEFFKALGEYDCVYMAEWLEVFAGKHLRVSPSFKHLVWRIPKTPLANVSVAPMTDSKPAFPGYLGRGGRRKPLVDI